MPREGLDHDALLSLERHPLIYLFRNKRRERMEKPQDVQKGSMESRSSCSRIEPVHFAVEVWFDQLQIPITEFVPHKAMECDCRFAVTVRIYAFLNLTSHLSD